MNEQQLSDSLAATCKSLMLEEPFYGLFMMGLHRGFNKEIPTAGVYIENLSFKLEFNPDFWISLDPKKRKGLTKHEMLHIIFNHITGFNHLKNKEISNIAMDLEINQLIDEEMLPDDGMKLELFPEIFNSKDVNKGTIYYYEKLLEAAKNNTCPNLNSLLNAMKSGKLTCEIDGKNINVPDHKFEKGSKSISEAEKKLLEKQIGSMISNCAEAVKKSSGNLPSYIEDILNQINFSEPPKFDWRGYLRRFADSSIKVYTKKTRRKESRRFFGNPGLKIKQKKHILVAIDTSGSVSNDELTEFMQEINHIYRTGVTITLVQADAAIAKIEEYTDKLKNNFKVYGRGGTSFQPVIDYYNENKNKFSALIYLTDGEASAPQHSPLNKILWVLSSRSNKTSHLPGFTIKLN